MLLAEQHVQLLYHCYQQYIDGATQLEIDNDIVRWCSAHELVAAFRGFNGYPAHYCASADDVVLHGIPSDVVARDCRVFTCDIGLSDGNLVTDAAWTACGIHATDADRALVLRGFQTLQHVIAATVTGTPVGTIGSVAEQTAAPYAVCRGWYGHGVGASLHEPPDVPSHGPAGGGVIVQDGMLLALEPLVSAGNGMTYIDDDGWTVRSVDGAIAVHHEAVVRVGSVPTVLTPWWETIPIERLVHPFKR